MNCKECIHDDICYMQETCGDIEKQLLEFGCDDYKMKQKTVPVDKDFCEIINWAARYAIGRRTYAAVNTARYILGLVEDLNWATLFCLQSDIERAKTLGDDCDKEEWLKLLDAVNKELARRENER